jgi:hypothetical protein
LDAARDIGGEVFALRAPTCGRSVRRIVFSRKSDTDMGASISCFANAALGLTAPLEGVIEEHIDAQFAVISRVPSSQRRTLHRF